MKKIIRWLYNRYCKPVQLDTMYIGGVQRKFDIELNPHDQQVRRNACIEFVGSGALENIINESLAGYVQGLFDVGESQGIRDQFHNNINVVLKVEELIEGYAVTEEKEKDFDKFKPI